MNPFSALPRKPLIATAVYALLWFVGLVDWLWVRTAAEASEYGLWVLAGIMGLCVPIAAAWIVWASRPERRSVLLTAAVASISYIFVWPFVVLVADAAQWDGVKAAFGEAGMIGLFCLGLSWLVWWMEVTSKFYEEQRREQLRAEAPPDEVLLPSHGLDDELGDDSEKIWNPLNPYCWAYGKHNRKLNQSLAALLSYSTLFMAASITFTQINGCQEIYELPAGGGGGGGAAGGEAGAQASIVQKVKVQKIKRKRLVINPFSSIKLAVPPIEKIELELPELTAHQYSVGDAEGAGGLGSGGFGSGTGSGMGTGEGDGAGFGGGTGRGKVRFIRLEYSGGDWNQDFGVGADLNMLIEYGIRTKQKCEDKTESRTIAQLTNFPLGKSPPVMYLTGQGSISLTKSEIKTLREYLTEKHGMLFGDNGGSGHFHNQFVAMMHDVLPEVRPVRVPLDDVIHRVPYGIPFLPYVVPHGGKDALGWKLDGRWVCYYHPGDISDAWRDGHSGVPPRITEFCYQLGVNVIFYGHAEYGKWLVAQRKGKGK